jgi:hypothetical protein
MRCQNQREWVSKPARPYIQAVLYHDLGQDMRRACQDILRARGALPALKKAPSLSGIQIVTPCNLPALMLRQS